MSTKSMHDLVIANGRVMDPETGLDAPRNVGVRDGTIRTISEETLNGLDIIDAAGLVVAPGFIDMHSHGQMRENYEVQARDGVTTALELELGTADVERWYEEREGNCLINHGASVGHIPIRMELMKDPGDMVPVLDAASREATEEEITEINSRVERGLEAGALAVGFGIQYTPGASHWEVMEVFRVAAGHGATCHVHMRGMGHVEPGDSIEGLQELITVSSLTGTPVHVCHINSSGLQAAPQLLQIIGEAQAQGVDTTTECYPYNAAMTDLSTVLFSGDWQTRLDIGFGDLEWAETGERLTAETFSRYRETGGMVILHMIPEESVLASVASPLTAIASDGYQKNGKGHPRSAGCYTRVLGKFVREDGVLDLMEALRKMALMPSQRLQQRAPLMSKKGRVQIGADADLVAFDPGRVIDRATYEEPTLPPEGMAYVVVNGVPVVRDSQLQEGVSPGMGIRAPAKG